MKAARQGQEEARTPAKGEVAARGNIGHWRAWQKKGILDRRRVQHHNAGVTLEIIAVTCRNRPELDKVLRYDAKVNIL